MLFPNRLLSICLAALLSVSHAVADEAESATEATAAASESSEDEAEYKPKSKDELRRLLTPMQYKVTQNEDTEPAFRNKYWDNKRKGTYECVVCGLDLFTSKTKYKSGTGWPSFFAPIKADVIGLRSDRKLFYVRTEVHCKRCGAHLGHVFDDGPAPTGKRYCMNSAALNFIDAKDAEKADRDQAQPGENDSLDQD